MISHGVYHAYSAHSTHFIRCKVSVHSYATLGACFVMIFHHTTQLIVLVLNTLKYIERGYIERESQNENKGGGGAACPPGLVDMADRPMKKQRI